jgi:hypothetical protein
LAVQSVVSQVSSVVSSVVSQATSVVSSAAAAVTSTVSSTGGLVFGQLSPGFASIGGLIAEGSSGRALTGPSTSSSDMTPAVCSSFCSSKGYAISATEYSSEWYVQFLRPASAPLISSPI